MRNWIKPICVAVGVSALAGLVLYGAIRAMYRLADAASLPPALWNFVPLAALAVFSSVVLQFTKRFRRRMEDPAGQASGTPDERRRQAWLQIKAKGKKRYVWRTGAIGWGLSTFATFKLVMLILGPRTRASSMAEITVTTIASIFIWMTGGYFFGLWMWKTFDDKYR